MKRSLSAFALLLAPVTGVCWDAVPACKQYGEVDAVFTGLVVDSGLDREDATWGDRPARVKVEQVFVGLQDEKEVEIDPGITTECYLRLRRGQRYFIYAKRDAEGRLRTSRCLGSIRLDLAQEDLQFALRAAPGGSAGGEVHNKDCAEVNVKSSADGRISGTLRDSTGAPLPKIMAQLAALDEDGELGVRSEVASDEDGHFEFTKLVAGTYVLGVNLDNEPSAAVPFPATRYPAPIPLAEGQKLSDIDLRLPPRLPVRTIHVQAIWPDGRPAAEVRIEGDCQLGRLETDTDGRALLKTLAGEGCSISARTRIGPGEYARSNKVIVPPGEHAATVVLALH